MSSVKPLPVKPAHDYTDARAKLEQKLAAALDGKEFMGNKIVGGGIAFTVADDTDKIVNLSIQLKNEQTGKEGRVNIIAYRPVGRNLALGFAESSPDAVIKVTVMLSSPPTVAYYDIDKDANIRRTAGTSAAGTPEKLSEVRDLLVAVDATGAKFATLEAKKPVP